MKSPLAAVLLVMGVAWLPSGLPAAGWYWEALNGLGLLAIALLVALAWEAQTPARPHALRLHQHLAIAATALVGVHTLGFLLLDPVLLEHLKPTAPWPMWMAVAGLSLLLVLTVFSSSAWRRWLWGDFERFRRWHPGLSLAAMVAALAHVIGTGSTFGSVPRAAVLVGVAIGLPLLATVSRRRRWPRPLSTAAGSPRLLWGSPVGWVGLCGLLAGLGAWIRQP